MPYAQPSSHIPEHWCCVRRAIPAAKSFLKKNSILSTGLPGKKDLLVITDEIYEYLVYDGKRHISPATIGNLRQRTVSIMGFSKTFSITGWRLGYTIAPPELARAINLVNDLLYVCAPAPLQHGVTGGLQAPPEYFETLRTGYQRKRDLFCKGLASAGLTPLIPDGVYYVLADASALAVPNAKAAALALLQKNRVAAIPGSAFYRHAIGQTLLRFCFAKDDETLHRAAEQLQRIRQG